MNDHESRHTGPVAHVLICCDDDDMNDLVELVLHGDAEHTTEKVGVRDLAATLATGEADTVITTTSIAAREHPVSIARRGRPDVRIIVMCTWSLDASRDRVPGGDVYIEYATSETVADLVAAIG